MRLPRGLCLGQGTGRRLTVVSGQPLSRQLPAASGQACVVVEGKDA
jgi:hypothetical protein